MPITPDGTAYTIEENGETENGARARWYVADHLRASTEVPLLLFSHGNGATYTSLDTTAQGQIRDWLVDHGWAVFEADSGGTSNFGNDAAQQSFIDGLAWVDSRIDVGTIAAMGVSMGGVAAYWMASLSPMADRINHVIIQQGVSDLTYRYTATTSGTQVLGYAYGIGWSPTVNMDAWNIAADGHDPMWTELSAWEGKHVLQLWDDADATVAWEDHGEKWVGKYGQIATTEVVGTAGYGHTFNPSHRAAAYDFLSRVIAPPTIPPQEQGEVWKIRQHRIVGDDFRLYPIAF